MQYFENEGILVGVFGFPILKLEEGKLSTAWHFVTRGYTQAVMIIKSRLDPVFEIIIDGRS